MVGCYEAPRSGVGGIARGDRRHGSGAWRPACSCTRMQPGAMPRFQGLAEVPRRVGAAGRRPGRRRRRAGEPAGRDLRSRTCVRWRWRRSTWRTPPMARAAANASGESLAVRRRWAMILGFLSQERDAGGRHRGSRRVCCCGRGRWSPADARVMRALGFSLPRQWRPRAGDRGSIPRAWPRTPSNPRFTWIWGSRAPPPATRPGRCASTSWP